MIFSNSSYEKVYKNYNYIFNNHQLDFFGLAEGLAPKESRGLPTGLTKAGNFARDEGLSYPQQRS